MWATLETGVTAEAAEAEGREEVRDRREAPLRFQDLCRAALAYEESIRLEFAAGIRDDELGAQELTARDRCLRSLGRWNGSVVGLHVRSSS
jgi:hypothetical protein